MKGRTYRYFTGKPLYGFGYGLSYTTFAYSDVKVPHAVEAGEPVQLEADVKNTGSAAGDEVVEVYLTQPRGFETPIHALAAFTRVHLERRRDPLTSASPSIRAPSPRSMRRATASSSPANTPSRSAAASPNVRLQSKPRPSPSAARRSYPNKLGIARNSFHFNV